MLYLDFVDACRNGYSGRVEKCIQLFAIMLQGNKFRNYAGETHGIGPYPRLFLSLFLGLGHTIFCLDFLSM